MRRHSFVRAAMYRRQHYLENRTPIEHQPAPNYQISCVCIIGVNQQNVPQILVHSIIINGRGINDRYLYDENRLNPNHENRTTMQLMISAIERMCDDRRLIGCGTFTNITFSW